MPRANPVPFRQSRATSRALASLLVTSLALPLACAPDPVGPIDDAGHSGAGLVDAGAWDAGADGVDAGRLDAGLLDAGLLDAGDEPMPADGNEPPFQDAGSATDAGEPIDASDVLDASGSFDGGDILDGGDLVDGGDLDDGGAWLDAGALDDGGTWLDAGEAFDAGPPGIRATCFPEIFDDTLPGPDYDQFAPVVGSHCYGTDHQDITGIERVVFLGDSVTVGSPPTLSWRFYRAQLAERLADHFNLTPPDLAWRGANPLTGESWLRESGDFASCARWGARTDDLLESNSQLEDCLPADKRDLKTLVVMTVGGNDVAQVAKSGAHAPYEDSWVEVQAYVERMRTAVEWLKEPGRFPNGVSVVFANTYEFTDGTADVESCPAVGLGDYLGFDTGFEAWDHPEWLRQLITWANEQYMQIAVDTGSDMLFLFEHFCGHGFNADDPTTPCYRGPNTERWFDLTCIHPTPTGHTRIADMFMEIILE